MEKEASRSMKSNGCEGHEVPARQLELKAFLTAARARLRAEDVGLPLIARRRSPGLRREEVAELAGVSLNWYASFEIGSSERRFSMAFVARVADTLRLNARERIELFRLALPEVAELAEHFNIALADAEKALLEAQAAAGKALATAIFNRLIADASVREARAATGRVLADAIYDRLLAQNSAREAQAAHGRMLADSIFDRLTARFSG